MRTKLTATINSCVHLAADNLAKATAKLPGTINPSYQSAAEESSVSMRQSVAEEPDYPMSCRAGAKKRQEGRKNEQARH